MGSLNVSLSGAKILGDVAGGKVATVPELASKLRLTPTKIRLNLSELEQKGWAHLDADEAVHITPEGENAYAFITLHPEIISERFEQPIETDIDLDAALEAALRQERTEQPDKVNAAPERDNNQGSTSRTP